MKKILFSSFLLLATAFSASSQNMKITGVVTDENNDSFPGVTIMVKNTTVGTSSDTSGVYGIEVANDSNLVLVFSFFGFQDKEILVAGRTKINVMLEPVSSALDELVVVGYGTTTYKELTGATARVKGEDIEKLNLSRMDQALQGQIAGVAINTNSGSPGGSSSIRTRGLSTFGDNDPLILVDGVVYDSEGLNALNPSDIKSVNVLKDATAGIYGVRAANGVIIVEHKLGHILANAGIDRSNIESDKTDEKVLLLPENPDQSAQTIRSYLSKKINVNVGVLITDSMGRAWRLGTTGHALGSSGIKTLIDLRQKAVDLFQRELQTTCIAWADQLAAAAMLVMGESNEGIPVVIIKGINTHSETDTINDLIRPKNEDLFR